MQIEDLPTPQLKEGQLLVEIHATSVNPIDWKIRDGMMSARYGKDFPMVLGFDASGVVVETAPDVSTFNAGDEIFSRSDIGPGACYAEFAALNASTTAHKPAELSHEEAAAMPLAALTALNGLRDIGRLKNGQRVLIVGAAGGVGTYAVQIAKNMGADVTGICSGANAALATELGADRVIDYKTNDPLGSGLLFDVIYDTVGSLDYAKARESLTENGVYLTLVPVDGIDFFFPGQTEIKPKGGYFLVWAPTAADMEILAGWVRDGKLRSVIDSSYRLDEIRQAHERSQTLHARGKIVVRMKG